ncbi:unnamed protein product [Rhodiola kirilowii]
MEARVLTLTCAPPSSSSQSNFTIKRVSIHAKFAPFNLTSSSSAVHRVGPDLFMFRNGKPNSEKRLRNSIVSVKAEEDEEERKVKEYREIGRLLRKETLTEIVLTGYMESPLILARRDEEKDAIRSLDLLYRRVEMEILKSEASPAMRLLNELLNLHDGYNNELWLKECKKLMVDTFPREDPFSLVMPAGFDIDNIDMQKGPFRPPPELEDPFLKDRLYQRSERAELAMSLEL